MQTPTTERSARLVYQTHDLLPIPEDVPALEVVKGDRGIIRKLVFHDNVVAFVEIPYSTGRTRGWVLVEIAPEEKVLSYTLED